MDALNIHMSTHVVAQTLNSVSSFFIAGGFKPQLRMDFLNRSNLALAEIKGLALKCDNLQKKKKPHRNVLLQTLLQTAQMKKKRKI